MTYARTSQLPTTAVNGATGEVLAEAAPGGPTGAGTDDLTSEILVEEVSIDGMCGVY